MVNDHGTVVIADVLNRNPDYLQVVRAHHKLFGHEEAPTDRYMWGREDLVGCIYQPIANRTGLPLQRVEEAYRWLMDAEIVDRKNHDSPGGDAGDSIRLAGWNFLQPLLEE